MRRTIGVVAIWLISFGSLMLLLPLVTLLPAGYGIAPSETVSPPDEEIVSSPTEEVVTTLPAASWVVPPVTALAAGDGVETKPTSPPEVGSCVGNLAPDFTLQTIDGKSIALSDLRGKKVLLNFWSTHCGACIVEFPFIRAVYDEHGRNSGDLAVITICVDARVDRIAKIIRKYGDKYGPFDFPILLDEETATKDSYHIWTVPMTVFLDSDGVINRLKPGGFNSQEAIEEILESL